MKIIIGLGNIGKQYQNTRHNLGFLALDYLKELLKDANFDAWSENKKFMALVSQGNYNGEKLILVKPTTFMNNSGFCSQAILAFYKETAENLIVLHDDIDIKFGDYKLQKDKSCAGHRGVQSIIEQLKTQNFTRLRLGIGKENQREDTSNFVLKRFGLLEKMKLNKIFAQAIPELIKLLQ